MFTLKWASSKGCEMQNARFWGVKKECLMIDLVLLVLLAVVVVFGPSGRLKTRSTYKKTKTDGFPLRSAG